MTSGLSAKTLSPNHGLVAKLKRQARRIYRQNPRRVVLVAGLTVLKTSVILYWALPFLCPNTCVLRRIPALHGFFPELREGAQLSKQVGDPHAHAVHLSMTGCHSLMLTGRTCASFRRRVCTTLCWPLGGSHLFRTTQASTAARHSLAEVRPCPALINLPAHPPCGHKGSCPTCAARRRDQQ